MKELSHLGEAGDGGGMDGPACGVRAGHQLPGGNDQRGRRGR